MSLNIFHAFKGILVQRYRYVFARESDKKSLKLENFKVNSFVMKARRKRVKPRSLGPAGGEGTNLGVPAIEWLPLETVASGEDGGVRSGRRGVASP